jgi:hypothetical protein
MQMLGFHSQFTITNLNIYACRNSSRAMYRK